MSGPARPLDRTAVSPDLRRLWVTAGRPLVVGLATGVLGGMAAFMYTRRGLAPPGPEWYPTALVVVAGAYTYLLAGGLKESVAAAIVGFFAGVGTLVAAWIAPLWLLPYSPFARALLLPSLLQRAVAGALSTYLLAYLGGYLAILSVAGYLDW